MPNEIITIFSRDDLRGIVLDCLKEFDAQKATIVAPEITFSINEVARRLKRSHATIKKLIAEGILQTTADKRRVLAVSLENYLNPIEER